jgi:hypothetical protein
VALSNFQYLWNGLTFGAGTDIQIVKEEGLRSIPPVRSGDVNKPRMDGAWAGFNFLGERIVVLTLAVTVTKDAPFETVIKNIADAFQPTFDPNGEQWLQFMYPGWDYPRQVKGRVTKVGFPTDLDYSYHRLASLPVEITCSDPVIYDSVLTEVSQRLPSTTGSPVTTLSANASLGATSFTVVSNGGFVPGMPVYVNYGAGVATPAGVVSSLSGSTILNLEAATTSAYSSGASVRGSSMPIAPELTNLTSTVSSGTALSVVSNVGFFPGEVITIGGATVETRVVASLGGSTTINLTTALTASHAGPGSNPSTTLSATAPSGSWRITVASATGIVPGMSLLIAGVETVRVASVSGTTVWLTTQLSANRSSGATVVGTAVGSYVAGTYSFPPTSGGALLVDNIGNYPSFPTFTIAGPVTNPKVTLASTGEFFGVTTSLSGSDTLVIDMKAGTVILNGTATRYGNVAFGSTWFGIPPGAQSVQVSSTDSAYVLALFTIDMYSAWSWS